MEQIESIDELEYQNPLKTPGKNTFRKMSALSFSPSLLPPINPPSIELSSPQQISALVPQK